MRLQRKNKIRIKYALFQGVESVYEDNGDGGYVTETVDGVEVPIEIGKQEVYSTPVEKLVSYSTGGKNAIEEEYGINPSDWNAMIMAEPGRLPIDETSLVWRNNSVTYRSDGTVDPASAEYKVVRVLPSLGAVRYLLQKLVDGNENN